MRRFLVLAALVAAPAQADALQDQVLARMRAVDTAGVGFTATTRFEQTGKPARTVTTRYDPRAPAGRRWSIVGQDGAPLTAKERENILKGANASPLPGYGRLARWFGAPATRVAQTAGSVTYRFARLRDGVLKIGSHDASGDTAAEATVDTSGVPYVSRVRFTSTSGFRMMLVARVERYAFVSTYALLPDGRPFPAASDAEMAGSMMGKAGSLVTRTRYEAH